MKTKIDLDKFICSWLKARQYCSDNECGYVVAALREQGLDYKDGEIIEIDTIDASSPEWAEIVEECKHNNLEQAKKSNKEKLMEVDCFDAELNALLKKYEYLPKNELAECLNFYLGVVQGEKKPKWSEEDEIILNHIIEDIDYLLNDDECFTEERRQSLSWLKSLKQRMEE